MEETKRALRSRKRKRPADDVDHAATTGNPDNIHLSKKLRYRSSQCSVQGCEKSRKNNGKCVAHGGSYGCKRKGCKKKAQTGGFCCGHGGGIKCGSKGCSKFALKGGKCQRHGGGDKC